MLTTTISDAERNLRVLCASAGFRSLRAMCAAANVDRMTVRLALRGARRPRPETITRIATALGCSVKAVESAMAVRS